MILDWLRRKKLTPKQVVTPERIEDSTERRPVQKFIYPPVANGIPRFPVAEILEEHKEVIKHLQNLSEDKGDFELRFLPLIKRYAGYVYLLPASEAHHHRGAGGLLRHGLEVAKFILQQAYGRVHGMNFSPQKRILARERWLFAGFVTGIYHDIGKVIDMRVVSVTGRVWDPFSQPLALWCQGLAGEDDRIYVSWRREGQDHRQMGLPLLSHILRLDDVSYLQEMEPLMMWVNQAILGEKGPHNSLTGLLHEADRKSVTLDLENSNLLADLGSQVKQPLARHFVLAMQRLVLEGRWRANTPGSVLWVIGSEVYLTWPEMAGNVIDLLHGDGIPGIPSNPDVLADVLQEHGLLVPAENGSRLWRLWPAVINAGEEGLLALRLTNHQYIMDIVPPSISGEVCADGDKPRTLPASRKIIEPKSSGKGSQERGPGRAPSKPDGQPVDDALGTPAPDSSYSSVIMEEPETPKEPRTLEEMRDYFAAGGLGGRALLHFASEVFIGNRRDGVDYKLGPNLLLSWGERKFTGAENLSELIESLDRMTWLVLNGSRRVHEDKEFGKCLKLRERETALFLRLVWLLREAQPVAPELKSSLEGELITMKNEAQSPGEIQCREPGAEGLPGPTLPSETPAWVSEVAAMQHRQGALDYARVKKLVEGHTGLSRGILQLLYRYFEVGEEGGRLIVLRRLSG